MNKKIMVILIIIGVFCLYMFFKNNHENNNEGGQMIISNSKIQDLTKYAYEIEEVIIKNSSKQSIYGILYKPVKENKMPAVIYSHGLGSSHNDGENYAKVLASYGVATYCFDFRGGSSSSKSEGKTTEMSVMTEVEDLETVVDEVRKWSFIDSKKIVLLGSSQGGAVSALVSSHYQNKIAGTILLYPGFVITDIVHETYSNINNIPETLNLMGWITVGKNYATDVWDLDFYEEIKKDEKKILIIHGTKDPIVPISYSERANQTYKDSQLYKINGAGHGFNESQFNEVMIYILGYLQEIGII